MHSKPSSQPQPQQLTQIDIRTALRRNVVRRGRCHGSLNPTNPFLECIPSLMGCAAWYQPNLGLTTIVTASLPAQVADQWRTEAAYLNHKPDYVAVICRDPGLSVALVDGLAFLSTFNETERSILLKRHYRFQSPNGYQQSYAAFVSRCRPFHQLGWTYDDTTLLKSEQDRVSAWVRNRLYHYAQSSRESFTLKEHEFLIWDAKRVFYSTGGTTGQLEKLWLGQPVTSSP